MRYTDLIDSGASTTKIQEYLVDGGIVPVTLRIPKSLRDSARQAASLSGLAFTSFVKQAIIEKLTRRD